MSTGKKDQNLMGQLGHLTEILSMCLLEKGQTLMGQLRYLIEILSTCLGGKGQILMEHPGYLIEILSVCWQKKKIRPSQSSWGIRERYCPPVDREKARP